MGHLKHEGFLALIDEASLEGAGELDEKLKNEAGKLPIVYLMASWDASGGLVERYRKKAKRSRLRTRRKRRPHAWPAACFRRAGKTPRVPMNRPC